MFAVSRIEQENNNEISNTEYPNKMKLFNILAILMTLSAGFSYINHRFIKLPTTIGVMAISLLASLVLIGLSSLGIQLAVALVSAMYGVLNGTKGAVE